MKIGKAGEKFAEQKNDCGSIGDFDEERSTRIAAFNSLSKGEWNCYAYDEQKKRKDQISRRPAIPLCVFERPINVRPSPGIVDKHHARDRETAKDVERNQAIAVVRHKKKLSADYADYSDLERTKRRCCRLRPPKFNSKPTSYPVAFK